MAIIKYSESGNVVTTLDFDSSNFRGVEKSSLMGSILESNAAKEYGKYLVGDYLILLHSSTYTFRAFVSTGDSPSTPVANNAWICVEDGTYTNFGSTVATQGQVIVYDGANYSVGNGDGRLTTLESDKANLASPTFTGTVTLPKTTKVQDTSADHTYDLAVSELTANRIITLPLLTGNDEFVFKDHTQTLTNKTLTAPQISQIELGHASDTTLTRTGAGVVAVEGKEITTNTDTQTLTNKRLTSPKLNEDVELTATATQLNEVTGNVAATEQRLANVDLQNKNDHKTLAERINEAVAAVHYNTALVNYANSFIPEEDYDGGTDISSVMTDGDVKTTVKGRSWDNVAEDTWATALTGWTSDYDSIVSEKYRLTHTADATGERAISDILDVTKYWFISVLADSESDTAGGKFDILEGTGGLVIASSGTLAADDYETIGLILQPSDLTGHTPHLLMTHKGSGYTEFNRFNIVEITSAEYAEGLATMLTKYPYHSGLRSTEYPSVEFTGVNLLNPNLVTLGYYMDVNTGDPIANANHFVTEFIPIIAGKDVVINEWAASSGAGIAYFDSKFNYISGISWTSVGAGGTTEIPEGAVYTKFSVQYATLAVEPEDVQFEYGTTSTTLQPFTHNIKTLYDTLRSVPSAQDEWIVETGEVVKETNEHTLVDADILSISDQTNIAEAIIKIFTDGSALSFPLTECTLEGYTYQVSSPFDDTDNIGTITRNSLTVCQIKVGFTLGTSIATAKAALVGKKFIYQLATPSISYVDPLQLQAWTGGQGNNINKISHAYLADSGGDITLPIACIAIKHLWYYVAGVKTEDTGYTLSGTTLTPTSATEDQVFYVEEATVDTTYTTNAEIDHDPSVENVAMHVDRLQAIATKTAAYTLLNGDRTVLIDASGGAVAITLPASPITGIDYIIKAIDITNAATVVGTIDGVSGYTFTSQYEKIHTQYDGTNWWRVD